MDLAQRLRQRHGDNGEQVVRCRLVGMGMVLVEKVKTPWRIVRGPGGKILKAYPTHKVSGDFRAVMPGGRSVLVEVKWRESGPLAWNDLEPHQHHAMKIHQDAGGLSLIGWATPEGVMIFTYAAAMAIGWRSGCPLKLHEGEALTRDLVR